MGEDISALNQEMVEKGVRVFVGGLHDPMLAERIECTQIEASETATQSPKQEYVNGLWVLDVKDLDEARQWGVKAAQACRAHIEIREFH